MIDILTMQKTHILATSQNQWVIARKMEGAGGRTVQQQGIVQHRTRSGRLRSSPQFVNEPAELFVDEATEDAEVLPAVRVLGFMR